MCYRQRRRAGWIDLFAGEKTCEQAWYLRRGSAAVVADRTHADHAARTRYSRRSKRDSISRLGSPSRLCAARYQVAPRARHAVLALGCVRAGGGMPHRSRYKPAGEATRTYGLRPHEAKMVYRRSELEPISFPGCLPTGAVGYPTVVFPVGRKRDCSTVKYQNPHCNDLRMCGNAKCNLDSDQS